MGTFTALLAFIQKLIFTSNLRAKINLKIFMNCNAFYAQIKQ